MRGVLGAVHRARPGRRVVEGVRLGGLAARAHEQLDAHGLLDVGARVRRHAAHQVGLRSTKKSNYLAVTILMFVSFLTEI